MALHISLPPSSTTLAALTQLTTTLIPVDVAVTSTPTNVDQLLRQIQISGTVAAPPNEDTVTLATALGKFSFSLSQLPEAIKQQLLQQLETLFQNQKPVTATIQPGAPPTQAILLLPLPAGSQPQPTPTPTGITPQLPPNALPPLTLSPGTSLPAVVLPPGIVIPGAPTTETIPLPPQAPSPQSTADNANPVNTLAPALPGNSQTTATNSSTPLPQVTTIPPPSESTAATSFVTAPVTASAPAPTGQTPPPAPSTSAPQTTAQQQTAYIAQQASGNPAPLPTTNSPSVNTSSSNVLLQPGKEITLRIDAISAPSAPPPMPSEPNQIPATVIGNGPNGQLILKTPDATLYIRSNVEALVGTNLLMTPEPPKTANPAILLPLDAQNFDSLQETLSVLTQINPQLAQQFASSNLPQPGPHMAGPLLFFLSALKQGDVKNWLGTEITDALTKGGKLALLNKLTRDIGAAPQTERDSTVGEWKSYPVPLQTNGQFQTLTLHVHSEGKGSSSDGEPDQTSGKVRFLIDVRMSSLGLLQLDGLVRPKKLDMIVRSESALPPGVPQDLRDSYTKAIDAMGFTGSLSFQTGRQHWLEPRKQIPQSLVT